MKKELEIGKANRRKDTLRQKASGEGYIEGTVKKTFLQPPHRTVKRTLAENHRDLILPRTKWT